MPPSDVEEYFTDPDRPGFLPWGLKVNAYTESNMMLSILDLPDMDYSSWYEDGLTPRQAYAALIDELS
jgi:hypothetical protein